jgi:hypothetical protein
MHLEEKRILIMLQISNAHIKTCFPISALGLGCVETRAVFSSACGWR